MFEERGGGGGYIHRRGRSAREEGEERMIIIQVDLRGGRGRGKRRGRERGRLEEVGGEEDKRMIEEGKRC